MYSKLPAPPVWADARSYRTLDLIPRVWRQANPPNPIPLDESLVEYMREQAGESGLWTTGGHFGDWLAFASTASDYPGATPIRILLQQPISPIHKTAF